MQSQLFTFLLSLATTVRDFQIGGEPPTAPKGILDKPIRDALEAVRPTLKDIKIKQQDFVSGPQEFGNLNGTLLDLEIKGLDEFNITILKTFLSDINNLTIVVKNFKIKGQYSVDGFLAFPLGKSDIKFYGDGELSGEFQNLTFSMALKLRLIDGIKVVNSLDIFVDFTDLNIYLKNLMGGGELETVFNSLINDVGMTVIYYYKDPFLEELKSNLIKIINEILNPKEDNVVKEEL